MEEYTLNDIWRTRNENKREYSWIKNTGVDCDFKASRIDLALVTPDVNQLTHDVFFLTGLQTDHRALVLIVEIKGEERGPGYWKLNSSLLNKQEYVAYMNEVLDHEITLLETSKCNDQQKWERIKKRVKSATIAFTKQTQNDNYIVINQLFEYTSHQEAKFPLTQAEMVLYTESKKELESLLMEKISGTIFRSKAKWYAEGDRSSKYFFNLEKNRAINKTCKQIFDKQGNLVGELSKVLEIQREFYQELYAYNHEVEFAISDKPDKFVHDNMKLDQSNPLTIMDLKESVDNLAKSKSPGPDGLTAEFYQAFWPKLGNMLMKALNDSYTKQKLYPSARQGILNLIPKPNRDTRNIKNLRPITLLNVDYKILEKTIANKILPALKDLIHNDQRGFLPGRRISVNIRKMLDIIESERINNKESVIISCDFLKAFDKIKLESLYAALRHFNFAEYVVEWTQIMYTDFTDRVQNSGFLSDPIRIEQGLHQGGPCSSLYFLVIAELLANLLRKNTSIQGIDVESVLNLLNQFADDLDVFSNNSEESIRAVFDVLEFFYFQTGLKINYDKTTIYRIGSLRHSKAQLYTLANNVRCTNENINVLGVNICHENLLQNNYDEVMNQAMSRVKSWTHRGLSLLGKVTVINVLVASLFVYKIMVLPNIPNNIINKFNTLIQQFLWGGGEKVK